MELDMAYICTNISNLSGIPARSYSKGKLIGTFSNVGLEKDPLKPYENELLKTKKNVLLFITSDFSYYGVVSHLNQKIIIGPSFQLKMNRQKILEMAFLLGVDERKKDTFISEIESIIPFPLNAFGLILCLINYVWNEDKVSLDQIIIKDNVQNAIVNDSEKYRLENSFNNEELADDSGQPHNTYLYERTMLDLVKSGDWPSLKELFMSNPPSRGGKMAEDSLRQEKDIVIASATLISRAAIQGGLDVEEALSVSDAYIQKAELMNTVQEVANVTYAMARDLTLKVHELHHGIIINRLTMDVKKYVKSHLSDSIKTSDISVYLGVSRGYLSTRFKKETGMDISEFINEVKMEEAKKLLTYTDRPIADISSYLGFCSQSHFQNSFKKKNGMTPRNYRELKVNG